nr:Chain A, Major prion protein [Homo sapiens]
IIHFGS